MKKYIIFFTVCFLIAALGTFGLSNEANVPVSLFMYLAVLAVVLLFAGLGVALCGVLLFGYEVWNEKPQQ